MIRKKITIFLISFLLSLGLWLYVTIGEGPESERVFNIPVTYRNLNEGLTMLDSLERVEIKIRGSKQRLSTIRESSIIAYIDLKELGEGSHNLEVKVDLPNFLKVVEIYPSRISVYLDKLSQIEKNVRIDFIGTLKSGLLIEEPEIIPNKITISGPSKKLEIIRDVSVTVDLTEIKSDISLSLIPKIKDGLGNEIKGISFNPSIVNVNFKVKSLISSKVVPVIPKFVGELSGDFGIRKVLVTPSIVTIFGKIDELDKINYLYTEEIKINNLTESKIFNTKVTIPENLEIKDENKIIVQVIVEKKISKKISDINLLIKDKSENLEYQINLDGGIEIEVYGFISIINNIKPTDFEVFISVLDLTPGEYNLKINATTNFDEIEIVKIIPSEVKVIISKKEE